MVHVEVMSSNTTEVSTKDVIKQKQFNINYNNKIISKDLLTTDVRK